MARNSLLLLAGIAVHTTGFSLRTKNDSSPGSGLPIHDAAHSLHDSAQASHQKVTQAQAGLARGQAEIDHILSKAKEAAGGAAEDVQAKAREGLKAEQEATRARDAKLHTCLENKRIVFIGPSTSKSDYISLAYFAEYGTWPSQDIISYGLGKWGPNPISEAVVAQGAAQLPPEVTIPVYKAGCTMANPATCETYMRYSNSVFNGHEACDCYEFGHWTAPTDTYNSTENRVYINGNTMISYFQYFGDVVPPRGTFDITPLLKTPPEPILQYCPVGQFPGQWAWAATLPNFLKTVVRLAKPTHVVVSSSFWPVTPQNTAFWAEVAAAGAESVMDTQGQIIWKTTPQRIHESLQYRYQSPRIDMTPFAASGWKVFPAGQIVETFQGPWPNDAVFYDFSHLRPNAQCHATQAFLASHVCPGTPLV